MPASDTRREWAGGSELLGILQGKYLCTRSERISESGRDSVKWEEPEQSSEERTEVLVQQVGQERMASASAGCGGLGLGLGHRYTRSLLYQIKRAAPGPRTQQTISYCTLGRF